MRDSFGTGEHWDFIIEPRRKWLDFDFRELYHYRDLIKLFINRDFVTVYKQTVLGPLWFILNPLFTTVIYGFIFGSLAKIPTDSIPGTLFYYGGTMLWGYFSSCFNSAAGTFSNNAGLFGKVYFPRLTVPISKAFSNLITAGIQFLALCGFYVYFALVGKPMRPIWWAIPFIPIIFAELAALGTGFGMIVSGLTTKYRDLMQLVSFGVSLWMYATPIVYPLSQVPEKYRWLVSVNPVTAPIEGFRTVLYGTPAPGPLLIWISLACTAVFLSLGLALFSHTEKTFIDVV
jgi:lipopolysaccharide transport system permease protein